MKNLKIIGISVETTNQHGQSAQDIGQLWGKFYHDNIPGKINNKVSENIYSVYTNYEKDYTGRYTTLIGLKVDSLEGIPEGLIGMEFPSQQFMQFTARGPIPQSVCQNLAGNMGQV